MIIITEKYGVTKEEPVPKMPNTVEVIGYIDSGDEVQGLLVAINGSADKPDGLKYHITHSLSRDHEPVDTNKYTAEAKPIKPIPISVSPRILAIPG